MKHLLRQTATLIICYALFIYLELFLITYLEIEIADNYIMLALVVTLLPALILTDYLI